MSTIFISFYDITNIIMLCKLSRSFCLTQVTGFGKPQYRKNHYNNIASMEKFTFLIVSYIYLYNTKPHTTGTLSLRHLNNAFHFSFTNQHLVSCLDFGDTLTVPFTHCHGEIHSCPATFIWGKLLLMHWRASSKVTLEQTDST